MVKSSPGLCVLFGEAKAGDLGGRVFKEVFRCFYEGESFINWENRRKRKSSERTGPLRIGCVSLLPGSHRQMMTRAVW